MTEPRSPITPVREVVSASASAATSDDVWGATHLSPPPPGSITPTWSSFAPEAPPQPQTYVPAAPAPFDTSSGTPEVTDPDDLSDAWGATHLAGPPSGSLSMTPAPWQAATPGWTPEAVPASPTAFSPPDERGGLPAAQVPETILPDIDVPKPIRGVPVDQPVAGRFAAPEEQVVRTRRLPKRSVWIAAGVAVVVVAVVVASIWQNNRPVTVDSRIVVPTSAQASAIRVARGDLAVKGYLEALQSGDVEKAMGYGPAGSGSQVLLNSESYKVSLAASPITNIVVQSADATASTIHASYQLGTQAVVADYKVVKNDDGNWRLSASTTTVRLEAKRGANVPLLMNGTAVGQVVEIELLPGTYTFTTGLPYLQYQTTTKITVNDLSYNKPIAELPLDVTPEGKDALNRATLQSLRNCLGVQQLAPTNCPIREAANKPLVMSSIQRRLLVDDPTNSAQWTSNKDEPELAQASVTVQYVVTATYADGGTTGDVPFTKLWTVKVDASKTSGQDLSILWS